MSFHQSIDIEEKNRIELKAGNPSFALQHNKFTISLHTSGNFADAVIYQDLSREKLIELRDMIVGALESKVEEDEY
jgi:2'-5' RNA ligase